MFDENFKHRKRPKDKYPFYKGQRIDQITILEDDFVYNDDRYMVKFQCDCGKIDYKRLSFLNRMQYKCCKDCSRKVKYPEHRKARGFFDDNGMNLTWVNRISANSNLNRGGKHIEFTLTTDDLYNQLKKQNFKCAYTGEPLEVINHYQRTSNASVDRIDSTKGYTPDNIQWVLKSVNLLKNDFPDDVFKNLCCKIADFTRNGNSEPSISLTTNEGATTNS